MAKPKRSAKPAPTPLKLYSQHDGRRHCWEITLAGKLVSTRTGFVHVSKTKDKSFTPGTPEQAKAKYDALVAAKRAEGFREIGELPAPTVAIARDADLEAAIREDRSDPAPYLVYADWLQDQGSPLGDLIVLAHAKKTKQASALAQQIGVPAADFATFGSRHGLWQWLRLENTIDSMDPSVDPVALAARLFASPLCSVLEELRLGVLRWEYQDQPEVIAAAGQHAWAADLQTLHVGDVDKNIDMDHHAIGDVGKAISKSFPRLATLTLRSGDQSWSSRTETFGIAGLDLPALTELTIKTCAMSRKRMKALTGAKLPALERLEVWFGANERGADAKPADVMPIFDGKLFPKLRHLGLRNSELVTDIVRILPDQKLAKQLESLDLSMGTMSDDDAAELAEAAKQLPKLKALDVGKSYVTDAGLAALKKAFKGVAIARKDMKEPYDWDPDGRYVSISE